MMALKQQMGERVISKLWDTVISVYNSLLPLNVSGTIVGIDAGILVRMRLYGIRIEDLQHLAKVNLLHQIVDVIVVIVVREYQQSLGNVACLCEADNQMT